MIALGIFSILLSFVGLQLVILRLLDAFGPVVGLVLKIGLIAAGVWMWRHDQVRTDEFERGEAREFSWVPVVTSATVVLGIVAYIALSTVHDSHLERQVRHSVPAAAWAATPTNEWPPLVMLQKAEFEHHTPMAAGCASLVRLPSGDIVALTAGHLLGRAGGVNPGFLHVLGGLDQRRLATLTDEITSWDLYLPGREEKAVEVVGLFGQAKDFDTDCDQVLLELSAHNTAYPVKPLDVRLGLVGRDETLRLITFVPDKDGTLRQMVYNAHRVPGLIFTCQLDAPADLNGCSGAPVVDKDGLLVGIVTGGTLMDLDKRSDAMRGFSGHLISELMPVLKTAMTDGHAAGRPMARNKAD